MVKIYTVVLEKKDINDDGHKPIAIGKLSVSGDLQI